MKQPSVIAILLVYAMVISSGTTAQVATSKDATAQSFIGRDSATGKSKFTAPLSIRYDEMRNLPEAKDGEEKEKAYLEILVKYPPEQFGVDYIPYDQARQRVALGFAHVNNVSKALLYLSQIQDGFRKVEAGSLVAHALSLRGHQKEAILLYKTAIANAEAIMADTAIKNKPVNFVKAYVTSCDGYADMLYKQKDYQLALHYAMMAHDSSGEVRGQVNAHNAEILIELGRDREAFDMIDEALMAGQVTESMRRELVTLYKKVKGSDEGYAAYAAQVTDQLTERTLARLPARMLDEPAPAFSLQDLDGNTVSLDGLKGQVVVVDFWATWCGPCKASFPMMETMVDKYKDSSDVKFLFIHTWEREGNPEGLASSYIRSMQYNFEVLMDLRDKTTRTNPVVRSFNVTGIPTKFVIDRNGHIRFKIVGFSRDDPSAVERLTEMIRLAGRS